MMSLKSSKGKSSDRKLPYKDTLNALERERYEEKLKLVDGCDPYQLQSFSTDVKLLPKTGYPDIVNYLLFTPSPYTQDDLKCYKGLEAYNQFVSGWVSALSTAVINGNHLVRAKVLHSQRMRESPLIPWVIAEADGKVLASHCTCMAGLGETCTHVAAQLFAIDGTVRVRDSRTVTQEPAYWLVPASVKQVNYSQTKDIDFSSAKALKKRFEKQINKHENAPKSATKPKKKIPEPTDDELRSFFSNLSKSGRKPAILSVLNDFSDNYVPKIATESFPKPLNDLKDTVAIQMKHQELLEKCKDIQLVATEEEIRNVEKHTRNQSKDKRWFMYRAGRVTASKMKSVCTANPDNPSQNLVKTICYTESKFSNKATQWGLENEKTARQEFFKLFSQEHENTSVEDSGLQICREKPFIAASPDGIVSCACCGKFCVEIKCPFKLKGKTIDTIVDYLTRSSDGKLSLDKKHKYYYQIKTQMGVTNSESCFFVVWTDLDLFVEQIWFDQQHWNYMCDKAESFFRKAVLLELVGKFYTRLPGSEVPPATCSAPKDTTVLQSRDCNISNNADSMEERLCYCDQVESGRMICCDNENCSISWFHFKCLKITNEPKGTWYCPQCRKLPEFNKKRQKCQ